ncbi:3-oxo-5-alpha-steroid 4-dehydrogenase [Nowakowskiella sp. JEL0078]|nr:3-oxo-5-alpha-steroid 4-dehydrogenase [Nowakowskiella sp. JEL0078]
MDESATTLTTKAQMQIAWLCRLFYACGCAGVCVASSVSWLNSRFVGYGKTLHTSGNIPNHWLLVPKRWFVHFYLLALLGSLALLSSVALPSLARITLVCFTLHATRRLTECLYVSRLSSASRMNILHYMVGLAFYCISPVALIIDHFDLLICSLLPNTTSHNRAISNTYYVHTICLRC